MVPRHSTDGSPLRESCRLEDLVRGLGRPEAYDHPVADVEVLETHISYLLLTGRYAYKLKKPVDLGFLDFSSLERREHFCREELHLNRRLAPNLYLDVVAVTGTPGRPRIGGDGPPLEFAVKMRQFPSAARLDRVLAAGRLTTGHVDEMAAVVAGFHRATAVAPAGSGFGRPDTIARETRDNFEQLPAGSGQDPRLGSLRAWTEERLRSSEATFSARRQGGFVRECHGDMHLENAALVDDRPVFFDCIEFSPALRWTDVMSDVAFLVMDFACRERPDLGRRLLDRYLEDAGDYDGVAVLPHYLVYRAMVRAKVAAIRATQAGASSGEREAARGSFDRHLDLAQRLAAGTGAPPLAITRGLSGSGKSTLSRPLADRLGAIRIRSDVERRRLAGADRTGATGSGLGSGLYAPEVTRATYERLAAAAGNVLDASLPVIVDATFLRRAERRRLADVATARGCPFFVLDIEADPETLRTRVAERSRRGGDPSEADLAVLERQRETAEPCGPDEPGRRIVVDTTGAPDLAALAREIRPPAAARGGRW